jgi:hypothetical protein
MNDRCRWPKQHVLGGQQSRRIFHTDGIFRVAKASQTNPGKSIDPTFGAYVARMGSSLLAEFFTSSFGLYSRKMKA